MAYEISREVIVASLPLVAKGAVDTLRFTAIAVSVGFLLGVGGVLARLGPIAALRWLARGYVEVIRNTPMLVQLYFVFYGLPRIGVTLDANLTAALALSLYCGAYMLEILRAGIEAVGSGQVAAARALGLSEWSVFRHVVLPQGLRIALPALGGQVIVMVKLSSLASVIGAVELTYRVVDVVAQTYRSFELYALAGIAYLLLTLAIAGLLRIVEARLARAA